MSDLDVRAAAGGPPPAARPAEGWHWPRGSRTAHYLRGGTSLCGRWVCHRLVAVVARAALPTDCAACRNSLGSMGRTPAA